MTAKNPQKWLVYRLSALGDVVLTTGVLDYLHHRFGWTFVVVTRAPWTSVFDGHPAVEKVVGLESHELKMPTMLGIFSGIIKQYHDFGLLDLHGTLRSHILSTLWKSRALSRFSWATVRCYPKFSVERRRFLHDDKPQQKAQYSAKLLEYNVPQRYAMAIVPTPPCREELLPKIYLSPAEQQTAQEFLRITGLGASHVNGPVSPLVALHPYSTHSHKAWLPEHWQALADKLTKEGISYFVIGQSGQEEKCIQNPRADFSNVTTLRETCALLAEATVLVTGDSGPMHLAGAVGTPVVALFGPTTKEWGFFPEGKNDIVLENKKLACRPCSLHGSKACTNNGACMKDLTPDMVMRAVKSLLNTIV